MEREIILEILLKYKKEGAYLNITLNQYLNQKALTKEQKVFITRVVYGTVQNELYLEYYLKQNAQGRIKLYERLLMMMSLYQHLFLTQIPDYAIVDEAVKIAKKQKGMKTAQFVNAVLKNAFVSELDLSHLDKKERLSIETSHPLWMVQMFDKQYGFETTRKICLANNEIPSKTARVNTLLTSRKSLIETGDFIVGQLSKDAVYYKGGNIAHTIYFKEGLVSIQDESSQCVALALDPKSDDYVLDMCCAPGGKTTHLATLMGNQGIIEAYDLFEHKIKLVEEQLKRLKLTNVITHVFDSTDLTSLYSSETFDKILLDAPCSGLGVLSRKPEIKYHDSSAMDEIILLQAKLLENAYILLKKNGKMIYSTCTINKKENEKQIEQFINKHPDMRILEEKTILPYQYHSDGFYICLLEKGKV